MSNNNYKPQYEVEKEFFMRTAGTANFLEDHQREVSKDFLTIKGIITGFSQVVITQVVDEAWYFLIILEFIVLLMYLLLFDVIRNQQQDVSQARDKVWKWIVLSKINLFAMEDQRFDNYMTKVEQYEKDDSILKLMKKGRSVEEIMDSVLKEGTQHKIKLWRNYKKDFRIDWWLWIILIMLFLSIVIWNK